MFDLHIHMILDGVDFRKAIGAHLDAPREDLIRQRLQTYAEAGICFLRVGGDAWGVCLRAKQIAKEFGIDYRTPAFPIYKRGHYGSFIGKGFSTAEEYCALLDEAQYAGADFIKLMISGLIDFSKPHTLTESGLQAEEISNMIDVAHRRGLAVMVHANGDEAVNAALDADVESVEHGAFLSEKTLLRLTKTMWVPTLATIGNLIGCGRYPDAVLKPLLQEQTEKVRFVSENGGLIGLGSDAGAYRVYHGQAARQEREYLSFISDDALRQAMQYTKNIFIGISGE